LSVVEKDSRAVVSPGQEEGQIGDNEWVMEIHQVEATG